jgi:hypothetical protein
VICWKTVKDGEGFLRSRLADARAGGDAVEMSPSGKVRQRLNEVSSAMERLAKRASM